MRPESIRSVLVMADEGSPTPRGDPMENVMRVFLAKNRALFAAVFERDLWPQIQLGFGTFPHGERSDPRRLAELVRRSHGESVTACAQIASYALEAGGGPVELTILTVHGLGEGASAPPELQLTAEELLPILDLTSPAAGRAR